MLSRTINIGPRSRDLILQVTHCQDAQIELVTLADQSSTDRPLALLAQRTVSEGGLPTTEPVVLDGSRRLEVAGSDAFDLTSADYTIFARIKTAEGGTIFAKAPRSGAWAPDGKTFFVRGGRLGFDIGWVGVVQSNRRVNDGKWHWVAIACEHQSGGIRLYQDGRVVGRGTLKPKGSVSNHVVRLAYTSPNFPENDRGFAGEIAQIRFYQRCLDGDQLKALANSREVKEGLLAHWDLTQTKGMVVPDRSGHQHEAAIGIIEGARSSRLVSNKATAVARIGGPAGCQWLTTTEGSLRLKIPAGNEPARLKLLFASVEDGTTIRPFADLARRSASPIDLQPLTQPGPLLWPEKLTTQVTALPNGNGPFAIDNLTVPMENPYRAWMRLGTCDFFADGHRAAVCTWMGDVWLVDGLAESPDRLCWQRMATGLFQPLGLKIVDEQVFVLGRDQITRLHDRNGDGEADFYECFNNDAQVTEHFHEFALELQTDRAGNFYYTKAARHAKEPLVSHHGTLIKVSRDGKRSAVLANGFRVPNGLAVNDDGTFLVSDQEGHWTPMNRINWVKPGGFYGYMWSYAPDRQDTSYDPPLCWIHKNVDRSPGSPLWVTSKRWGPLNGAMISLSYGTGRIFNVLYEHVAGQVQGGLVRLPLPELPTGVQRGRFHPQDGQLYVCGLFGWSSNQTVPGGFYRIRYTAGKLYLPIALSATTGGMAVTFNEPLDPADAKDPRAYTVERWEYRRTSDYGSDDYRLSDGRPGRDRVLVAGVRLSRDAKTVFLQIPDIKPCMQMRITYTVRAADGQLLSDQIDHTIHKLRPIEELAKLDFDGDLTNVPPSKPPRSLAPGLAVAIREGRRGGEIVDVRPSRLLAWRIPRGESPSPFLTPGPFESIWSGYLRVEQRDYYTFSATTTGALRLFVDGAEVLRTAGQKATDGQLPLATGKAVELRSGLTEIRAELAAPRQNIDSVLRVEWASKNFAREPIPPRLLQHDPLTGGMPRFDQRHHGRELFAARSCSACHSLPGVLSTGVPGMPEMARDNPSLAGIGDRLNRVWIYHWLLGPRALRAQATMPQSFASRPTAADRQTAADAATYLATLSTQEQKAVSKDVQTEDESLFINLGCIACHTLADPAEKDEYDRISLHYVNRKYRLAALRSRLQSPQRHYAWNPMPDFRLSPNETSRLAAHLRHAAAGQLTEPEELRRGNATRGKEIVRRKGCTHCHSLETGQPAQHRQPRVSLEGLSGAGCLAESPDPRLDVPDFRFGDHDRESLNEFLAGGGESLTRRVTTDLSRRLVRSLRCGACHDRDGVVSSWPTVFYEEGPGTRPEMAPPLTWAGEKLQPDWTRQLLTGQLADPARPWLKLRMAGFAQHSDDLVVGLSFEHSLDAGSKTRSLEVDGKLVQIGRELTQQSRGFHCVQCHGVGNQEPESAYDNRGINFCRVRERLLYQYYRRWTLDPLRVDPRTKMPKFSPDGRRTPIQRYFAGDARRQFDALWQYLQSLTP